ncbi:MAG: SMP-30/gluconolactonase/LRE family protein [Chitinophagaceae bacterium]
MYKIFLLLGFLLVISATSHAQAKTGRFEKWDAALDAIIDSTAKLEVIAEGFDWSEGPIWIEKQQMLLFSDVPKNIIYKWTEAKGKEIYLTPSGYTGTIPRGGEIGSNGLTLNKAGQLAICQHGNRQIAFMNAPLTAPKPVFVVLTNNYKGKKFNSPNDLVFNNKGELFFTDPPYGLEKNMDDPLKELPFQGIFKRKKNGQVVLLTDSISRPNGLAISPDGKTLIIANSDPAKPYWYAFDLTAGNRLSRPRIFYDASTAAKTEPGMPDGLKIDTKGNVYATGPGGVWIFDKYGVLLGKIKFDALTSNCVLSADEKTIYITADMYVLRVKLRK